MVPIEPTPEMLEACQGAVYRHIAGLSDDERVALKKNGGRIGKWIKHTMRWKAMLDAAPEPRGADPEKAP